MNINGPETEVLVREESVSGGPTVPVSLRTERVHPTHATACGNSGVVSRRRGRYEYEKEWRKKNPQKVKDYANKYARKWYSENKHVASERQRAFREKNREHTRIRDAMYRAKYADKRKAYAREYMRRLRIENPEITKKYHAGQIDKVADWYVRAKMSSGNSVPRDAWPENLVELKKQIIKTKRIWKRQKDSNTSTN